MAHRIPFRNRAHEVSRLEAFSDVIFGFSVSLLVVSLEAPKDYSELMVMMRGFIPFAIAFVLLIDVWLEHHDFFRRYALDDRTTIVLNNILLFVVLFYVYPMKFVFVSFVKSILGEHSGVQPNQAPTLFVIYGLGFAAVFFLLGLMYRHAYSRRRQLQLNAVEEIDTLESVYDNFATAAFGVASAVVAVLLPVKAAGLAGFLYFLIFIPKMTIPWRMGRKRRATEEQMLSAPEPPG
jgi:uncharacterized membrane protein